LIHRHAALLEKITEKVIYTPRVC